MADYIDSQGASASNGDTAEFSGEQLNFVIDGLSDSYYITRFAWAIDHAAASVLYNDIAVTGTAGSDQVFVNASASATENAFATSSGNRWSVNLGDGDDGSVIHTLAAGGGAGTYVEISSSIAELSGGGGSDNLHAEQVLSTFDAALVRIGNTTRSIDAGDGFDFINVQLTVESGTPGYLGGTAEYFGNSLYVNAGADGANIHAQRFITAAEGGTVSLWSNGEQFVGGDLFAGARIEAGNANVPGGFVDYLSNTLIATADEDGSLIYAQNFLKAASGGSIRFADNLTILNGMDADDTFSFMLGFEGGSLQEGASGGSGELLNNRTFVRGGGGNDQIYLVLSGVVELGGNVTISNNYILGDGGDGDDIISLSWWTYDDGSTVQFSGNQADLLGGAGADVLSANLGERVSDSNITISGGDGDDLIDYLDVGSNNMAVISGGAGDDTITDESGFTTVVFDGAQSEFSLTNLGGGWILVTDMRDGSPDGTDRLYQVDQLRFTDGDVLVADLSLPIEGSEGDDQLFGSDGDDMLYGRGGNDTLAGLDGNDLLDGGAGDDSLFGLNGNDILLGGDGSDRLIGNRGTDQLTGGAGADEFIFGALFQSTADAPDVITDFSGQTVAATNPQGKPIRKPGEGDKIDLSLIDANANLDGDQAFTLVQHGFSGAAGQAYSSYDAKAGATSLYLDVNGDSVADMVVQLLGDVKLTGADFIL